MKWPIRIPDRFLGFEVIIASFPDRPHVEMEIDVPGKKIRLNRAAVEAANVVQVRFGG